MNERPGFLEKNTPVLNIALKCLFGIAIFWITYMMTYHHVCMIKSSDTQVHLKNAMALTKWDVIRGALTGQDLMWHTLVKSFRRVLGFSKANAAIYVTTITRTIYYFLCCALMERAKMKVHQAVIPIACFVLCIVGPLYLPWFSSSIYLGQSSPNIWHSPTQNMVLPFALLIFWQSAQMYQRMRLEDGSYATKVFRSKSEAVVYAVLIVLSEYAKPSFFQVIVPGLGILMVIDLVKSKGQSLIFSLKLAAAFVPGAVMTVMKFVTVFYQDSDGEGVEIAPFAVWNHYSNSPAISFFLLFAFPIFIFVMDRRHYRDGAEGTLAVSTAVSGLAMKCLLAEKGERRYDGNFGWGYDIAATLIWFVAIKKFIRLICDKEDMPKGEYKAAVYGGFVLLAMHFIVGVIYLIRVYHGNHQL